LVWISIAVLPPTPADGNKMNATNAAAPWSKPSSRPPPRQAWRLGCAVG